MLKKTKKGGKIFIGKPSPMKLKIIPSENFELNLEHNALSSLKHGIEHYLKYINKGKRKDDLKFSIIHIFHSIELYLKARLAKESILLIYINPEKPITEDSRTVYFEPLLGRLKNLGLIFDAQEEKSLKSLKRMRNCIEHHKLNSKKEDLENYIAKAYKFLDKFLNEELDLELNKKIGKENYSEINKLIYTYDERIKQAEMKMESIFLNSKHPGDHEEGVCPSCYENTVLLPDPTKTKGHAYCYFCNLNLTYTNCVHCNSFIIFKEKNQILETDGCAICQTFPDLHL